MDIQKQLQELERLVAVSVGGRPPRFIHDDAIIFLPRDEKFGDSPYVMNLKDGYVIFLVNGHGKVNGHRHYCLFHRTF